MTKKDPFDIKSWAKIRDTSIEIAEVIFEFAENDQTLADKIWDEAPDAVIEEAFTRTKADRLYWGEQVIERKNV